MTPGWDTPIPQEEGSDRTPLEGGSRFQTTHWSVVLEAGRQDSPEANSALERLCRRYWYPLYCFVRRSGYSAQDAQDLTQAFFAHLLEKNLLIKVRRERGRFRSFLLVCLKNFLSSERQKAQAVKRGGKQTVVYLDQDPEKAEGMLNEEIANCISPDRLYDRSWAVAVLEEALRLLRSELENSDKKAVFEALEPFLMGEKAPRTYAVVAEEMGATECSVKMMVHRLRKRYRQCLRSVVAATVSDPEQIGPEIEELLEVLRAKD
jgi:RNA polymerase sigma-70 factor (ECF subfamily)